MVFKIQILQKSRNKLTRTKSPDIFWARPPLPATAASRQAATAQRASTRAISRSTAGRRRPLVFRQSAARMGVEAAASGGAVRPVKRAAAVTAAANPKFHLSIFKPKILEKIWDSEMSAFGTRIFSTRMSSTTMSRLFIMEMRRSDDLFFSFSSAQNFESENSVRVRMPPSSGM
jgi:hypothetical protein